VSEDTTRVTLSRVKREGWLDSRRVGRLSWYALTDKSWRLLDEGRERIFKRRQQDWDGTWRLIIYSVPEAERPVRERLRGTLEWLGFGTLAPSTWISPHDRIDDLHEAMSDREIKAHVDLFTAEAGSLERDRELAARCWDLDAIQDAYLAFIEAYELRLRAVTAGEYDDRTCFVERVRLVHDYRKFPFVDPDLPLELLPEAWAGTTAHALFLDAYEALRDPAFRHFESVFEPPPLDHG
jgi:phenylacetic acid degradation operon negative regulatory protein